MDTRSIFCGFLLIIPQLIEGACFVMFKKILNLWKRLSKKIIMIGLNFIEYLCKFSSEVSLTFSTFSMEKQGIIVTKALLWVFLATVTKALL